MKIANYAILEQFATPLVTMVPEEEFPFDPEYDENDPVLYKEVFSRYLKPYFDNYLKEESRRIIKDNLQYFLTTQRAPFNEILSSWPDSTLPIPDDGLSYFIWIWESLYPAEDFHLDSTQEWHEKYDLDAARELFAV